jgi:cyclase
MDRRKFLQNSGLAAGMLLLPWSELQAMLLKLPKEFHMQHLRNNVGYFTESGGTIVWMAAPTGIVVVDTQFPKTATNLIEELKQKQERKIDLLINTHHHSDHTAGNIAFDGLVDTIVSHENCKANQISTAKARGDEQDQLYPNVTFKERWRGRLGLETITLRHFGPAHTNGDCAVHFDKANVAHVGDLVFNRKHPYVDTAHGANITNWRTVLTNVIEEFDRGTTYVFGHCNEGYEVTGDQEDVIAFRDYLGYVLDFVRKEKKAGKTLKELLKATEIPGAPQWTGKGIERPITAAWEEV